MQCFNLARRAVTSRPGSIGRLPTQLRYQSSSSSSTPTQPLSATAQVKTSDIPKTTTPKVKKGFSSLPKVPSTITLKPKDILLDKLFSGYRPITLPIEKGKSKKRLGVDSMKTKSAVVYIEFDEAFDGADLDDLDVDNLDLELGLNGSSISPNSKKTNLKEDRNITRYQYSNYSFNNDKKKAHRNAAKEIKDDTLQEKDEVDLQQTISNAKDLSNVGEKVPLNLLKEGNPIVGGDLNENSIKENMTLLEEKVTSRTKKEGRRRTVLGRREKKSNN